MRRVLGPTLVAVLILLATTPHSPRAQAYGARSLIPRTYADVRAFSAQIDAMLRAGRMQPIARSSADTMLPWRTHDRFQQVYRGVPVVGGDVVVERDNGELLSVFGTIYDGIDLDVTPAVSWRDAMTIVETLSGQMLPPERAPTLVILPRSDGYVLAYQAQVATANDIVRYFIDARTGEVADAYSNLQTQSTTGATSIVCLGTGVLGDQKKVMSSSYQTLYYTLDLMRPAPIFTYDMKGNINRMTSLLNGWSQTLWSDVASSTNELWTDGAVVDAQVYAGYMYDYYYKRFGRTGLNTYNMTLRMFVHPIDRNNISLYANNSVYFTNAFYAGNGWMVFGEGLPAPFTANGKRWNYTSTAIDIVAHELSHGITQYSSNLTYRYESGALSEAFSDIMGTAIEFYFQPQASDVVNGGAFMTADYLEGEDAVSYQGTTPAGLRSLANPAAFGNPDHYSLRYQGTNDNGGVHINSTIASHAYYLAIEGGPNRTSGLNVPGVGRANRDQIEKVFYRGFVNYLTSSATFASARAATIIAARDLYGRGSPAEQAVIRAWDAVGVNVDVNPAITLGSGRVLRDPEQTNRISGGSIR